MADDRFFMARAEEAGSRARLVTCFVPVKVEHDCEQILNGNCTLFYRGEKSGSSNIWVIQALFEVPENEDLEPKLEQLLGSLQGLGVKVIISPVEYLVG